MQKISWEQNRLTRISLSVLTLSLTTCLILAACTAQPQGTPLTPSGQTTPSGQNGAAFVGGKEFVGIVEDKALVGFAIKGNQVLAYTCGKADEGWTTYTAWYKGEIKDGRFSLTSQNGHVLSGELKADGTTEGKLTLAGASTPLYLRASLAIPGTGAGFYRYEGRGDLLGLIVDNYQQIAGGLQATTSSGTTDSRVVLAVGETLDGSQCLNVAAGPILGSIGVASTKGFSAQAVSREDAISSLLRKDEETVVKVFHVQLGVLFDRIDQSNFTVDEKASLKVLEDKINATLNTLSPLNEKGEPNPPKTETEIKRILEGVVSDVNQLFQGVQRLESISDVEKKALDDAKTQILTGESLDVIKAIASDQQIQADTSVQTAVKDFHSQLGFFFDRIDQRKFTAGEKASLKVLEDKINATLNTLSPLNEKGEPNPPKTETEIKRILEGVVSDVNQLFQGVQRLESISDVEKKALDDLKTQILTGESLDVIKAIASSQEEIDKPFEIQPVVSNTTPCPSNTVKPTPTPTPTPVSTPIPTPTPMPTPVPTPLPTPTPTSAPNALPTPFVPPALTVVVPLPFLVPAGKGDKPVDSVPVPNKFVLPATPLSDTRDDSGLNLSKNFVKPGKPIPIKFNVPASATDWWAGIFPASSTQFGVQADSTNDIPLAFQFFSGRTSGEMTFIAPTVEKSLEFRVVAPKRTSDQLPKVPFVVTRELPLEEVKATTLSLPLGQFKPGKPIPIHFTASNAFDGNGWIGINPADTPHGEERTNNTTYKAFQYLSGRTSGDMTLTAPTQEGNYDFRLNDSIGGKEAAFASFQVSRDPLPAEVAATSLKLDKNFVKPGKPIVLHFTAASTFDANGWVGLNPNSTSHGEERTNNTTYKAFQYLSSRTSGDMTFTAPNEEGFFDFRLNDRTGGKEITSVSFLVTRQLSPEEVAASKLKLDKTTFALGEKIVLHVTAPATFDANGWVGLHLASAPHGEERTNNTTYKAFQYLSGLTQGDMTFTAPSTPGVYDFRMNDRTGGKESTSVSFQVK